jgi:O-antigen ligase
MIVLLLQWCNSTTSIVGLLSSAGVTCLAMFGGRRRWVVHVACLGVLALALTAMFMDSSGNMVRALGKDPSLTGRKDIWNMVLELQTSPLLGSGFESFWLGPRLDALRSALPNFPLNEAHNGFIEVYLHLGWAGIVFIACLLATGYARVMLGRGRDTNKSALFLGFLLCAVFYSFSEAGFRVMTVSWFFVLLVIIGGRQALCAWRGPAGPASGFDPMTAVDADWSAIGSGGGLATGSPAVSR